MAILRWGSSKGMVYIHENMGKLFDEAQVALSAKGGMPSAWTPPCDIYETSADFVLTSETPGVELRDIALEIDDNTITLAGERKKMAGITAGNYQRVERGGGKFVRSFTLPMKVDEEKISASLKDGVLTVTMPKKRGAGATPAIRIKIR